MLIVWNMDKSDSSGSSDGEVVHVGGVIQVPPKWNGVGFRVLVRGIPVGVSDHQVTQALNTFPKVGNVKELWMSTNSDSPRFGFVVFEVKRDAEKAVDEGLAVGGTPLDVSWSTVRIIIGIAADNFDKFKGLAEFLRRNPAPLAKKLLQQLAAWEYYKKYINKYVRPDVDHVGGEFVFYGTRARRSLPRRLNRIT
ncbi:uncharacterized protein LOC129587979 [Paramacrobiotus metropolitanus]|uniref:uncharacterized protein LOC129587979 n=1 Tax=Paramacrobiotus metropolitanus TaxID=2943436 RepID=UPI002445A2E9|nr:uncharacterized protein LOC129587979 [Paramacrobiotus metropolitanus]